MKSKHSKPHFFAFTVLLIISLMMLTAFSTFIDEPDQTVDEPEQSDIIFQEDFADNSNNWNVGSGENSESVIEDGKLKVESQLIPDIWNHTFFTPPVSEEDIDISVDTEFMYGAPENSIYGIACQYKDEQNYIWVVIRPIGTFSIQKQLKAEWTYLARWTPSGLIDQAIGATNNMRVACSEGHITLFINGILAADVVDTSLSGGSFRLSSASNLNNKDDTSPVSMGFSNLVVREALAWEAPSGVLFSESFDKANNNWNLVTEKTDFGYSDQIQGGQLLMNFDNPDAWFWKPLPIQLSDVDISFDATLKEGALSNASFGALCRITDEDNFYDFSYSFDDDGVGYYLLGKNVNGTYETLIDWTESTAVKAGIGITNRIRMVCSGSDLELYVNDKSLINTQDTSLTSGASALQASRYDTDEGPVSVAFDNLEVKYP